MSVRRVHNIAVDLIADDQGVVLLAYLVHAHKLVSGPHAAHGVGGIAHQQNTHPGIGSFSVDADNTDLFLLSCDYNIVWKQCPCLEGVRLEDVTPELSDLAYNEVKNS